MHSDYKEKKYHFRALVTEKIEVTFYNTKSLCSLLTWNCEILYLYSFQNNILFYKLVSKVGNTWMMKEHFEISNR